MFSVSDEVFLFTIRRRQKSLDQVLHIHSCLEPHRQQIEAAEFAVQEYGIRGRRMQEIPLSAQRHAGIADARRQVRSSEVVCPAMTHGFAGERENFQHCLALPVVNSAMRSRSA